MVKRFKNIVVLTGAGISAESGICTFRGQDGLWEGHPIDKVATPEGFAADPDLVYDFYNQRRRQLLSDEVQENRAHKALAHFANHFGGNFTLITQNVDDLHERAGSTGVIHMHGELLKARCLESGDVFDWREDLDRNSRPPGKTEGGLRPHIVWFGEMPLMIGLIEERLQRADLFAAIGTSGLVYPAAGFAQWAPPDCEKIEFNMEDTAASHLFDETFYGPAGKTVPEYFEALLT